MTNSQLVIPLISRLLLIAPHVPDIVHQWTLKPFVLLYRLYVVDVFTPNVQLVLPVLDFQQPLHLIRTAPVILDQRTKPYRPVIFSIVRYCVLHGDTGRHHVRIFVPVPESTSFVHYPELHKQHTIHHLNRLLRIVISNRIFMFSLRPRVFDWKRKDREK